jgi:hypothetical protein
MIHLSLLLVQPLGPEFSFVPHSIFHLVSHEHVALTVTDLHQTSALD